MRATTWKSRARLALAVAALGGLIVLLGNDHLVFRHLPKLETRPLNQMGRRLEALGLQAYWPMDDRVLVEYVRRGPIETDGTRRVPGVCGDAREILPGEHGYIRSDFRLESLGSNFTVSCWLRFPSAVPDQHVLGCLRVLDGRLVPVLREGPQPLAWPIGIRERFFHVAFTVDAHAGVERLYIDGERVAEAPLKVEAPAYGGVCFGQDERTPPAGFTLDEVALWSRALSPDEVRQSSRPVRGPGAAAFALLSAQRALGRGLNDAVHSLLLAKDLFNPLLSPQRVARAGLPNYSLVLSKRDIKAFNRYHNLRVDNGLNGPGASDERGVQLVADGRLLTARMKVVGSPRVFARGVPKRTFIVEVEGEGDEGGVSGGPVERFIFRPPEESPFLLETLAGEMARACAIPVDAPALCTLDLNGASEGVFLCERVSMDPALMWVGTPEGWVRCLDRLPVFGREVLRGFDDLARRYRWALWSDRHSPWTSAEMRQAVRDQRDLLAQHLGERKAEQRSDRAVVDKVCAALTPQVFLERNPMPESVLSDLDFSVRQINGAEVTFTSLTPEALDDRGHIVRGAEPRPAAVRVAVRCGQVEGAVTLNFTLAGAGQRLPILTVKVAGAVSEHVPALCLTRLVEANGRAGEVREGEIHIRGNTARVKTVKHYYEIEYAKPHGVAGLVESRHLLLTSMYRDPALMREKLAYDLFRSFSRPGQPRYAPHLRLIELVVNGEYAGAYAMTDRVDADLLGFGAGDADPDTPPVLYKAVGATANFRAITRDAYIQKVPRWRDVPYWGPYDELMTFIGTSDTNTFRARVEQVIDVDNAIDVELLLSLTCNAEGCNFNLFIGRRGGPGERFFIVPWDYDMTFWWEIKPTNYLIERLHTDLPEYLPRLKARWQELRSDVLSDAAVNARIDEMDALLNGGAAERNYRLWPLRDPKISHEREVQILRGWVNQRLQRMDRNMAGIKPVATSRP